MSALRRQHCGGSPLKSSTEIAPQGGTKRAETAAIAKFYAGTRILAAELKSPTLQRHLRERGMDWRELDDALAEAWATVFVEVGN
jgi:hypothetical protein